MFGKQNENNVSVIFFFFTFYDKVNIIRCVWVVTNLENRE